MSAAAQQPPVRGAPLLEIYDVAIVGLGPVGATLANLLALRGLSVLVTDREADIYRLPRAIHFDGECMRVFQTVGIADALEPNLFPSPGMRFVATDGRMLIDWSRPMGVGPQGWNASYRFHQPYLEQALRDELVSREGVDIRLQHDVFSVEPQLDAGHVVLRLEDTRRGALLRTKSRYVVGCDGARSTVRRFMGTELEDLKSHERWLVVDLILSRERPDLGDYSIQYCDPARPATYVRGVGMRRRWELMLKPGEDAVAMARPEVIWKMLSRWVTPEDGVLERPATYTFHSVVAQGWRKGRLLIAGDAAHQTPPFMGQGMCAGIRDASNLAWKLADVIAGVSDESLLDTYESERAPHVREFIETAVRLGQVIQTSDGAEAARRDAAMRSSPQMFATPQPKLGPGAHDDSPHAGKIGQQTFLPDGSRLDDLVGYRYVLVVTSQLADAIDVSALDVRLVQADAPLDAWLASLGAAAALVRPDRYIAGVAQDAAGIGRLVLALPKSMMTSTTTGAATTATASGDNTHEREHRNPAGAAAPASAA
ncbi:bifunctional 3-(3-hydroxy-phenyl)propionate/3-hydroxycinnamic acid hydroxylase [soil metagenome]